MQMNNDLTAGNPSFFTVDSSFLVVMHQLINVKDPNGKDVGVIIHWRPCCVLIEDVNSLGMSVTNAFECYATQVYKYLKRTDPGVEPYSILWFGKDSEGRFDLVTLSWTENIKDRTWTASDPRWQKADDKLMTTIFELSPEKKEGR
jgi:hypothetical protein